MQITTPIAEAEAMVVAAVDRYAADLLDEMLSPGLPGHVVNEARRRVSAMAQHWRVEAILSVRAFMGQPAAPWFKAEPGRGERRPGDGGASTSRNGSKESPPH
ncbi:hypothetical protein ASE63_18500 [Bosea sp. Root381]|uniref:hypothetical protein n=1 Tax=Bosea sp. Root381 TaxID=1736524 RepID=UPI0006F61226|nr:hypothetical protein [Bosea sp. Root381]KRE13464.1 hypothetical protein ASE63_18500 [Bosea sp. Root381]